MKSFVKLQGIAALCTIAAVATGGQPTFTNVRTVDYSPHCCIGNHMALVTAPNGNGVYIGDWYGDGIFYASNPLVTDGATDDYTNTIQVQAPAGTWSSGGWSYQSGGVDGNTVYMGGANDADTQLISVVESSPASWTVTSVTGITGTYSGPSVVGAGKLVMANYNTGGLQFFNIASNNATADGAEIANPNVGVAKTLSVAYDATAGKIFAYMVEDSLTHRIDVFNSNGTPAGTSYVGTWVAGVPSTLTAAGGGLSSHNRSAQITINNEYRILIAPFRDGVDEGWNVYDISTVGATGTPYKQIRKADLNDAEYTGSGVDITGSSVFTDGTKDYLALSFWNRLSVLEIGAASVSEWSLY